MDDLHVRRLAALADMAIERAELSELLTHVTEVVQSVLPAHAASLLLWDGEAESFSVASSTVPEQPQTYVLKTVRDRGGASRAIVDSQRPIVVPDIEHDPFVASTMLRDAKFHAYLGVPLLFDGDSVGVLYALDHEPREYSQTDVDFMTILARRASSALGLARLFEQVQRLASVDDLTGLYNRREFLSRSAEVFDHDPAGEVDLSAILLDVDHFKTVNDRHGHAAGDHVLVELSRRCEAQIRSTDIIGRLGGEEFAIVLPAIDLGEAALIAERIRHEIVATPISTPRGPVEITITLGVAGRTAATRDLEHLIDRADAALYAGKQAGRNRVVTSGADQPPAA